MIISLRLRLIVLSALIVLAGLMGMALFEVQDARRRVRTETASGVQVGRLIATNAIHHAEGAATPEQALRHVREELPSSVRHVRLTVVEGQGLAEPPPRRPTKAPQWFVRWVEAPRAFERHPIIVGGVQVGTLLVTSAPGDELGEVWLDWRSEMGILALISMAIILVVILAVSLALRPLSALAQAFDRMEAGDFAVHVGPSADPQMRLLAERFNRLAASLQQATADNRRLLDRLMSVQEEERKEIAHELHDEFGPSLFAIRADLGAISRWVRKKEPRFTEIQERLLSISGLVAQIQRINTRLLERLRPLVLEQMGLSEALERLIVDWRDRYPELTFKSEIAPVADLGEAGVHALYRAAVEGLTNVVRHAEAKSVEVRLTAGRDRIVLTVEDDGRGFAPDQRFGFGLLGMADRARAAGGGMEVAQGSGGGTRVTVSVRAKGGKR